MTAKHWLEIEREGERKEFEKLWNERIFLRIEKNVNGISIFYSLFSPLWRVFRAAAAKNFTFLFAKNISYFSCWRTCEVYRGQPKKKLFPIVLRHLLFFSMLQQRATLSFLSPSSHMRLKTLDCCAIICQTLIWASCRFWEGRNEEFRRLCQFGWLQAQHGDEMSLRCWRVAFQK